jgi:hypothetical protein
MNIKSMTFFKSSDLISSNDGGNSDVSTAYILSCDDSMCFISTKSFEKSRLIIECHESNDRLRIASAYDWRLSTILRFSADCSSTNETTV